MKIMHVLASNHFSGAENVVCQIISMFKEDNDFDMIYCSPDGKIREALEEREIKFVSIKKLTIKEIKRIIKEYKPDVIHAHDMRASFISACSCGKIRLISHIHNNAFDSRGVSVKSVAYLLAGVKAKRIFWVSKSSYEGYIFHKLFAKKSDVLYNIINVETVYKKMFSDNTVYHFDVVYLGRLQYPKNPERLLNVFSKVIEKNPNIKMAIVGTGDLESELKIICKDLNLQDNVYFLGFQSNPLKILHDAKVMVMTSRYEGTPMVALEALALGVPIVSTPVDGLKDLIQNDTNGYISDNDLELANKILDICSSEKLRDRLSQNAVEGSKKYNDIQFYIEKIKKYYNN